VKILHVHDVAFVASNLVSGLNEIGVEAKLYEIKKYSNPGAHILVNLFINFIFRIFEIFRFKSYINKNSFDVIHIHYGSFSYLAMFNNLPFYLHIHGTDVRENINHPILGLIIKLGIKKAIKVFYSTPDLYSLVNPYRKDAIFIPNPIDIELFKPKEKKINKGKYDIFVVSKIDKYKGYHEIIKSLELLLEQQPNLLILLYGFGNATSKEIINSVENFKEKREIMVLDPIPHSKVPYHLQKSKVILGQLGTGILTCSELEAMSCGKVVVCNFSYEGKYQIDPPIVYAENSKEAAEKISYLLKNDKLREMIGIQARKWAEKFADRRTLAKAILGIYLDDNHNIY